MKITTILFIGFAFFTMTSCKKSYNCNCSKPGLKEPAISTVKMKEEDAKNYCAALSADWAAESGSCYLSAN